MTMTVAQQDSSRSTPTERWRVVVADALPAEGLQSLLRASVIWSINDKWSPERLKEEMATADASCWSALPPR